MNGTQEFYFLSIVGIPGIGKATTLGQSVYQHSLTTRHFHVKARCTVGQVHEKRRLLLEILQEITGQKHDYHDDDLDQKLYQCLKCRRYLIFMDDIWDIQAWKDIKASFPDDENGSRIMFTSRFHGIASHTRSASISYHLSPLPMDKSWKMLQKKIFENKHCPQELVTVGQEVAASCKGLALAIDLIAGILRVTKAKKWKKVAETMNTYLFDDPQGRCQKVLELSYQDLPDDMKPCFLYFAAFPADADVPTWKLILLWMAEGFIYLQWDEISEIGNLEYLQVLKLKYNSFEGPIWDMVDGQVQKLRYLSLHGLDLGQWNALEDHLSCLEELHPEYCEKLEKLPSC